jgi:glyoxylate utilization-related uncharacterized protein
VAHTHTVNSVVIFLSQSTFGIQNAGEKPVITAVHPGDMAYRDYGEKPVNHKVWNQETSLFHFVVVELLKQAANDTACSILSLPGMEWQWQKESVSAYKLAFTEAGHCRLPKSNCAWLLIGISGIVTAEVAQHTQTLQAGEFLFFPARQTIEIKNSTNETAGCVLLQLK